MGINISKIFEYICSLNCIDHEIEYFEDAGCSNNKSLITSNISNRLAQFNKNKEVHNAKVDLELHSAEEINSDLDIIKYIINNTSKNENSIVVEEVRSAEVDEEVCSAEVAKEVCSAEVAKEVCSAEVDENVRSAEVAQEMHRDEDDFEYIENVSDSDYYIKKWSQDYDIVIIDHDTDVIV